MNDFWKDNDLDGSQGDLRALGHPQLLVIFHNFWNSSFKCCGHIVAATKVNNEFFVNDDAKDIQAVSLDYINKNVILIAYKE